MLVFFQVKRDQDYDEFERRAPPPSFTTVPPTSLSRRHDYDDIRQQEPISYNFFREEITPSVGENDLDWRSRSKN